MDQHQQSRNITISFLFDAFPNAYIRDIESSKRAFAIATKDIPSNILERAALDLIATRDRLPTVVDIRKIAKEIQHRDGRSTIEPDQRFSQPDKPIFAHMRRIRINESETGAGYEDLDMTGCPDCVAVYDAFMNKYPDPREREKHIEEFEAAADKVEKESRQWQFLQMERQGLIRRV